MLNSHLQKEQHLKFHPEGISLMEKSSKAHLPFFTWKSTMHAVIVLFWWIIGVNLSVQEGNGFIELFQW